MTDLIRSVLRRNQINDHPFGAQRQKQRIDSLIYILFFLNFIQVQSDGTPPPKVSKKFLSIFIHALPDSLEDGTLVTRKDRLFAKLNLDPVCISEDYVFIISSFFKNKRASDWL